MSSEEINQDVSEQEPTQSEKLRELAEAVQVLIQERESTYEQVWYLVQDLMLHILLTQNRARDLELLNTLHAQVLLEVTGIRAELAKGHSETIVEADEGGVCVE
jgi:hypothetical protein